MSDQPNYAGHQRKRAMSALATVRDTDVQAERAIKGYIELLEARLNAAHTLLSQDNHYSEKSSAAWTLLGETLGKVSSTDQPFDERAGDA